MRRSRAVDGHPSARDAGCPCRLHVDQIECPQVGRVEWVTDGGRSTAIDPSVVGAERAVANKQGAAWHRGRCA